MILAELQPEERPREKLLQHGAAALSDAELLAIFLRVGIVGKNAVELAEELILHFGSLWKLFHADEQALCQIKGMGQAKFVQLQAVLEMARRALSEEITQRPIFSSANSTRDYLRLLLAQRQEEVVFGLFLDTQHRLLMAEELNVGTLSHSSIYPREIAKRALQYNAAALILAHNHPSGSNQPSQADIQVTQQLHAALALFEVRLLDHLIVARGGITSLAELGYLF